MKASLSLCAAALLLLAAGHAQADDKEKIDFNQPETPNKPAPKWLKLVDLGQFDERLKGYKAPEGIKVEIVADAPTIINPVGMTFSDDGTPYVLEWLPSSGDEWREKAETFTYKDGTTRNVATMTKKNRDVAKILRDSKGNGTWDTAKVILEEELPSTIMLHDGWLYVTGRGSIRRYKQSKPDGPYDIKEVIAQGFCGFHHHQVSGLTLGLDGRLYVTSGDDDNYVEGSDGSRATVLRTGAVFRCKPDGSKMETFAQGFRNPYRDVAFDSAYNIFHADNDNEDGSKFMGCRLMQISEGNDFGWRLRQGARCCVPDNVRGAIFGELPGKVPPLCKTGRGSPAGLLIYNDTCLPKDFRGWLYYPDVFRRLIRAYRVEPDGAGFEIVEQYEFLSAPADSLFRPCQMVTGPDGAIYIVDWRTDSGGAGKLWGDGVHGRIYKVSWAGTPAQPAIPLRGMDTWAKLLKLDDAELIKTLSDDNFTIREKARLELTRRGAKNKAPLLKLLADPDQSYEARYAALGVLQSMWDAEIQSAVMARLDDVDSDLRRLAADALGLNAKHGDKDVQTALLKALNDNRLSVRRSVAMAMGHLGADGAADALVNTLAFDEGDDVNLYDGLIRAIEMLGKPGIDRLLSLANSGVEKDLEKVVYAFVGLRTREAANALPGLLKNPHLSAGQRAGLIRSYSNYLLDPPLDMSPLLTYMLEQKTEPAGVKLAGLESLSLTGALKSEQGEKWILALIEEGNPALRLSLIRAAEDARLNKAVPRLVTWLKDADRPAAEREAVLKALRVLRDPAALVALRDLVAAEAKTPEATTLQREAFRALASLQPAEAAAFADAFLSSSDIELQRDAVRVLGTDSKSTARIGKAYLDKKLRRELLPEVTEALRRHSEKDAEVAKLLVDVMRSGLTIQNNPAELERFAKLVGQKGNATRGRALFLNGKTLACINCHRLEGVGGSVGPDLTGVWTTHTLEKIIESIVEPSKEIKEGFQTFVVTTNKGVTVTGLKISQTADEVVIREATGRDVRILTKDIDDQYASKISLMPDNVISLLTYDQFLDLLAFLKSQKEQETLRGLALDFQVVGPFGADLKKENAAEGKIDLAAEFEGEKGVKLKWQSAQADPSGLLNLKAIFNKDNSSAYALTFVYAAKPQNVQMLVGTDGPARIWVNGAMVHQVARGRAAKPDEDTVNVALKEGWNPVLTKVVNGNGNLGLYLRFVGSGLRVSRTPTTDKVPVTGK